MSTPCPLIFPSPFLHRHFSKWQAHVPCLPYLNFPALMADIPALMADLPALMHISLPSGTSPCPHAHVAGSFPCPHAHVAGRVISLSSFSCDKVISPDRYLYNFPAIYFPVLMLMWQGHFPALGFPSLMLIIMPHAPACPSLVT